MGLSSSEIENTYWFRNGLVATSTTWTGAEPNNMGDDGMMLEIKQAINVTDVIAGRSIQSLELIGACYANNTIAGNTSHVKCGIRFGSNSMLWADEDSVTGTTPKFMKFALDLMPYVSQFVDGACFTGFAGWANAGSTEMGTSTISKPNCTLYLRFKTA